MSREQWGHGYHKGVQDALDGKAEEPESTKELAEEMVKLMWRFNQSKFYDKTLYSVRELKAFMRFSGVDDNLWKRIYNYILHNEPYGCYVSGSPNSRPEEDCFVLPDLSNVACKTGR